MLRFELLRSILNIIWAGMKDSLSFHRSIPLLYGSESIIRITASVIGANIVVFIGFTLIYSKGISPMISFVTGGLGYNSIVSEQVASAMYHTNWLIPVCVLCYITTVFWYQDLSDHIYKQIKHIPKETSLPKTISNNTFGFIVWLMAFIQVQLLTSVIPMILKILISSLSSHLQIIAVFLQIISFSSLLMGLFMSCCMYGWYGFDPIWISGGIDPDERLGIIETHWSYFFGFGLPYVIILKLTSFFVGYGIFLALFPFCIMMGCTSDYRKPYLTEPPQVTLRLFQPARVWTLVVIKYIDQYSGMKNATLIDKKKEA